MTTSHTLDFVTTCYSERPDAIRATISACLNQLLRPASVWLVDDGSPIPVTSDGLPKDIRLQLVRLDHNLGISAARMTAISRSSAGYLACVNVDILPAPDWAEACLRYLAAHERVGAVYTRLSPADQSSRLSRWRMRFHEQKYGRVDGPSKFAPGHAVLFRRRALDEIGGYNPALRRIGEDSEICQRLWAAGWEVHFVGQSHCISIQTDTLRYLARKQLMRDGFDPDNVRVRPVVSSACVALSNRVVRNIVKARLGFLPIDLGVFALEMAYLGRARASKG